MNRSKAKSQDIRYKCGRKVCKENGSKNSISIKTGTWFGKSHFSLQKSLFLTYCFVYQLSYVDTIRETSIEIITDENTEDGNKILTTSTETVCDYKNYCREICVNIVLDESDQMIGVPGKVVEIDESKFGKRKSHKGCNTEGQWVFGGICREDRKCFLVTVPNREKRSFVTFDTTKNSTWDNNNVRLLEKL